MPKLQGRSDINMILGMSVIDATKHLEKIGYTLRILQDGNKSFMVKTDYLTTRVNVKVNRGYIEDIFNIG